MDVWNRFMGRVWPLNYLMIEEALQTPTLIQNHLEQSQAQLKEILQAIRSQDITHTVTIARGSSDHAAQFFSYILAQKMGLIPSSLPPSLITLHNAPLRWKGALALAISQSGASPDLCRALAQARAEGALTMALVNQIHSPLAQIAQYVLPMGAGEEKSVAATKTFLLSLVNALLMAGIWADDRTILNSLHRLPSILEKALQMTRDASLHTLQKATSLPVISRGTGLPIAQEIALKFNEVCRLPALAFSAAEFRHGPMALVRAGDPVLLIGIRGPEWTGLLETARFLKDLGARVIYVAPQGTPDADISYPVDEENIGDPILVTQILYPLIAKLAVSRGYDPDQPAHLRKVTMTL